MCLFSRATKLNIQLEWGRSITNKVNLDTLNDWNDGATEELAVTLQ